MRILVTGADGQLGRACRDAFLAAGHDTTGIDLPDGDLAASGTAGALLAAHRPGRVIHCAAYTAVDRAESERDAALAGNATATANLARACEAAGVALTAVSTDYVLAGTDPHGYTEDAPRAPINWYGETKARAEAAVATLTVPWQVVRTSWLFGHGPQNFVRTIRRLLGERERLRVVDDQRGCPTYAPDLAELLVALAGCDATGIFHGTNSGDCTWYEFAREIARLGGEDPDRIQPCSSEEFPTPARRPACSILRDERTAALGLPPRPPWRDALARYVTWLETAKESPEK
jgi:dTDP-4-dehydrorhamnose reductase